MIRLVGRRLIIPQGDTGTFTIPVQGSVEVGDRAIFAIYDKLTQQTVREIPLDIVEPVENLQFNFTSEDTLNIEPDDRGNRYVWDITIQRNPLYDNENQLIHYDSVDSYYAAFDLPPCVIKRVTRNVQE